MKRHHRSKKYKEQALLYNLEPKSPLVEAYRNMRANLNFLSPDRKLTKISFTSTDIGDGKTMTLCNLAIIMARNEQQVLIIDADLRRPKIHKYLNLTNHQGLTDVLTDRVSLEEAIREGAQECLKILPSGTLPPNPAELLASRKMSELLDKAGEEAEIVLIDSPIITISDAAILGNKADGVIFVVQSHESKEEQVREAQERLERANANILGTVLNLHPISKDGKYYNYYYPEY